MMTQEIEKENKFQYLNQAKTEGSIVHVNVCCFPPTTKNYERQLRINAADLEENY
jgi:hypothetical protein